MNKNFKPLFEINLSTVLISTASVLAKLIELPAPYIIFLRCVIAVAFLFLIIKFAQGDIRIREKRHIGFFILSGTLLAGHWVTYFMAIQESTVAIAVIAVYTHPVITTIMEPVFFKTKTEKINIIFSIVVIGGITILVWGNEPGGKIFNGIILGIISSWMFSLRNILSKKYISKYSGYTVMFYQLLVSIVVLIPIGILYFQPINLKNMGYLIFLGLVSTAIGHALFVRSFKHYTASAVSIISAMLPLYAIIWAYMLLNEIPETRVLAGGIIIFGVVYLQNHLHYKSS